MLSKTQLNIIYDAPNIAGHSDVVVKLRRII